MAWDPSREQWTAGMPGSIPASAVPGAAPTQDPILVTVGDIACSQHYVITPAGTHPLSGTMWIVNNQTMVSERIPAYAIVLAVIFALACLLGLLFLLIKERTVHGFVQVSVQGPGLYYATQVPVSHPGQIIDVERRVNYIRTLAAAA